VASIIVNGAACLPSHEQVALDEGRRGRPRRASLQRPLMRLLQISDGDAHEVVNADVGPRVVRRAWGRRGGLQRADPG
jgi:hypothetical protein